MFSQNSNIGNKLSDVYRIIHIFLSNYLQTLSNIIIIGYEIQTMIRLTNNKHLKIMTINKKTLNDP